MKKWTLATMIRQLRSWILEAIGDDILDLDVPVMKKPIGDVIDELRRFDLQQRVMQIPGQMDIDEAIADVDGEE